MRGGPTSSTAGRGCCCCSSRHGCRPPGPRSVLAWRAAGAAYLFDGASGTVLETFTKPLPATGNQFGFAVAAVGSRALIGAPFDSVEVTDSGTAYLFDGPTIVALFRKRLPPASFGTAV